MLHLTVPSTPLWRVLRALHAERWLLAGTLLVTLAASAWLGRRWADAPGPVPDHAAAFTATQAMSVAGQRSLAQVAVPARPGLVAVDLLLAAEGPQLPGRVQLEVLAWPARQVLRTAHVPAAALPARSVWEVRPGQPAEQWTVFGFAPIPDSAGRELLLVLSYPDGVDTPGARVMVLAHFPSRYPPGQLLVNGFPERGNLLFRLSAAGTRGEAVWAALENLARRQPIAPGSLVAPTVLALACAGLGAAIVGCLAATGAARRARAARGRDDAPPGPRPLKLGRVR